MNEAAGIVDLQGMPLWGLWLFALSGMVVLGLTLLRMMPPYLRIGRGGLYLLVGAAIVVFGGLISSNPRSVLWFAGVLGLLNAIPFLFMGKLPADMPSARDPAARRHPEFA